MRILLVLIGLITPSSVGAEIWACRVKGGANLIFTDTPTSGAGTFCAEVQGESFSRSTTYKEDAVVPETSPTPKAKRTRKPKAEKSRDPAPPKKRKAAKRPSLN